MIYDILVRRCGYINISNILWNIILNIQLLRKLTLVHTCFIDFLKMYIKEWESRDKMWSY